MRKSIVASSLAVLLGVIGCGGGDSAPTPSYAKKVMVNEEIARKTISLMDDEELYSRIGFFSAAKRDSGQRLTPQGFIDSVLEKAGMDHAEGMKAQAEEVDPDENTTTLCHYSGSYHIESQTIRDLDGRRIRSQEQVVYTDCVHNADLGTDDENDEIEYRYSGAAQVVKEWAYAADKNTTSMKYNLGYTVEEIRRADRVLLCDVDFDMQIDFDSERTADKRIFIEFMDGKIINKEYKETGELDEESRMEAKEFTRKIEESESPEGVTTQWDGYMSRSDEDNSSIDRYIYAKNFIVTYMRDDLRHETYDGILGADCLGGAVELATTKSWDTNRSISDVAPMVNRDEGNTPFRGKTTISGKESSVVVEFGLDEYDKAYGKFIFDNGTESAHMRRSDMEIESCD